MKRPSPAQTALLTHFAMVGNSITFDNAFAAKFGFSFATFNACHRRGYFTHAYTRLTGEACYLLSDAGRAALGAA